MVRKAFLASQTVRACSPDYKNETMHRAKGGNNSKIAHQSQRQMIKIRSQLYFSAHFIIFFRSCYEDFVHCIYCAVVCFSTIIKITSILASLVLFFLLFLLWSRIFLWLHWIARVCTFYSTKIYIFQFQFQDSASHMLVVVLIKHVTTLTMFAFVF